MANRLMRGTVEFELDDIYYILMKSMEKVYFQGFTIERNKISIPNHWAQFSRIDGLDLIAYIHKYGKIIKIDMEYTWQHWFDGNDNPYRYSRLELVDDKIVSTEYEISKNKNEITTEAFLEAIKTKEIKMIYRDGFTSTTLSSYLFFYSWFDRLMIFSNQQISKGKGNRFYAWITRLALKHNSFVAMSEKGRYYASGFGNITFQDKTEIKTTWNKETVIDELTKNEILFDDPRRMRIFFNEKEILVPLFKPLIPHQRYWGEYKGNALLLPGKTEFISLCEACKNRIKVVTGDTHCLSYCEPEITSMKKQAN